VEATSRFSRIYYFATFGACPPLGCRALAEPWADTGTSTGRLTIAVLGGLADTQKAEARRRRAQGATLAELAGSYGVGKSTFSRVTA
jgi:DNA invertase Pin-like site-specific DNA recombinase